MLELLRLDCVVEMSPTVGQSVPGPRYDCPNGTYSRVSSVIQINKNFEKMSTYFHESKKARK